MKHFIISLFFLLPTGMRAQSATDLAVDSLMKYLAKHTPNGLFVSESNGRSHAKRGEITIDNTPMGATGKILRGIQPFIDRLPHQRKMADERTGEVLEGRIAMRLQPEVGDTSAYFLLTYNRSTLRFKYGVNSPSSISLTQSPANGSGVGFEHQALSAAEAAPVVRLFDELSKREDARVMDTLFQYDGADKDYEWWRGATDGRSRTKARIVLLPSPTDKEMGQWWDVINRYNKHEEVTTVILNKVKDDKVYLTSVTCAFRTDGAFHLYLAGHYGQQFCLVRVEVPSIEECQVVPGFVRLINRLTGMEQPMPSAEGQPTRLIAWMEKERQRYQAQADAQSLDTLFVSNDREGHVWWQNLDHPCPTRAQLLRVPLSEKAFDALHQRIKRSLDATVKYDLHSEGEDYHRIVLIWTDQQQYHHAYLIYYFLTDQHLIIERADGLERNSICIPHYRQEWFDKYRLYLNKRHFRREGEIGDGVLDGCKAEEIIVGNVDLISGNGAFRYMPHVRRIVFNGSVGHIDAGAIDGNPELREVIFNGPVFSTGGSYIFVRCPKLERVVFNSTIGSTHCGAPYDCPAFKGYEVNGPVLNSAYTDVIARSDFAHPTKAMFHGVKMLEDMAEAWMNSSSKHQPFIKGYVLPSGLYNIACAYSLAGRKEDCLRLLRQSVEAGFEDYYTMRKDSDFVNVRSDERFQQLLETVRKKGDKLYLLQQSAPYQTDTARLEFTYDLSLPDVRSHFHLDSIAGTGSEVEQMKRIMYWLHDAIRHDGSNPIPAVPRNSIALYEACKAKALSLNCRGLAIILSELYLSMGWPARFVTCESKAYDTDNDCHVITMVWSKELGKWIWMDPTFAAYVTDENGTLLGIDEVRTRLIENKPLVLNEDANWNHQSPRTKEDYLERYMAKNLYVLSTYEHSTLESEGVASRGKRSIALIPSGFTYHGNRNVTTDDRQFFAPPVME